MRPITRKIRQLGFSLARAGLRSARVVQPQAVFIMGHMRCGSTLLMHILLNHPQFIGCGERNAPYRFVSDLDKLELDVRLRTHLLLRRVLYVVDQINHDKFTPNPELLRSDRVRCVFLVRSPEQSIQSLLELTSKFYEAWPVGRTVDYYVSRLETLAAWAEELRGRSTACTYTSLLEKTPVVLRQLQTYFGLDSELHEDYELQPFTGLRGDPSEKIRAGRIIRSAPRRTWDIPDAELQRATVSYQRCLLQMNLEP